ncbi:Pycsar system effector family protein [Synechococcus elongatus IITB4]|uniref:Pycsar system effector family protein n=1 Tax=Synechococcus elongatus TaxID=32046 RepID=UPI0030CB9938
MNKDEIDLLDKILSSTNNWLKFAESKNGAIIAVICTVMFGVSKIIIDSDKIPNVLLAYLVEFFAFSFLSLVISLSSFIPKLKKPFWFTLEEKSNTDNPFYFADVCKYDSYSYLELLGIIHDDDDKIVKYMAEQVVINSRIAALKFNLFETSIWLFLAALLTPFLVLVILFFKD